MEADEKLRAESNIEVIAEGRKKAKNIGRKQKEAVKGKPPAKKKAKGRKLTMENKTNRHGRRPREPHPAQQLPELEEEAEEEEEEEDVLPWQDWEILYPFDDKGTLRFAVNMYGSGFRGDAKPAYAKWEDFHADGAGDMIDSYIRENYNHPPWSGLLEQSVKKARTPRKVPLEKASAVDVAATGESEVVEEVWGWGAREKSPSVCRHDIYEEEVTYKTEGNAGYCKDGCYLFGLQCGACSKHFVADLHMEKSVGKEKSFRPTMDCAIYCCINMGSNAKCRHALCGQCFAKGIRESSDIVKPRSQRKRRG